jgi:hypothetical protein
MLSKKRLEGIVALAIIIMLVLLIWWLLRPRPTSTNLPSPDTQTEQEVQAVPEVSPLSIPTQQAVTAGTIARIFVERFGSYSSQSDFANVDDVKVLATPRFQSVLERQKTSLGQADKALGYTGVSTKVISIKTLTESEAEASFSITTQREDSVGSPGNTSIRYQDVEISLVKTGDDWLVDNLVWQ